jgi:hypothetical protein
MKLDEHGRILVSECESCPFYGVEWCDQACCYETCCNVSDVRPAYEGVAEECPLKAESIEVAIDE